MAIRTDKNSYTILFAVIMVVVVGTILAYAAEGLKGRITEKHAYRKTTKYLYAMGINDNDERSAIFVAKNKVGDEFSKYITKQLVIQGDNVQRIMKPI